MQKFSGFFGAIIDPARYKNIDSVLVVMHANVEFVNFLAALGSVIRIAGVIPKASSKKFANLNALQQCYPVFDIDRSSILASPSEFIKKIDCLINLGEKLAPRDFLFLLFAFLISGVAVFALNYEKL
ncbi:hypothetical protein VC178_00210 [Polynucleobacter sp. AP-Sanab-80-C2]|uniref:hypothetical protein n=1 Tax=Polynucleobacter sp. AP-Sanab-80-C2 TaxID=3108274 RepID=UPI002B22C2DA|nr:hypothetical protein [Polynucleobacter sp. AP-Sanab-80-C2]MEA9598315.1 hypothetical protein [Polynucleobacter sp. AP-Sanab-80-C2]